MPATGPLLALTLAAAFLAPAQDQALREAARLDAEGKCEQSEPLYRQALSSRPPTPALLNNAGNHYLLCGQPAKARSSFEALLKLSPTHQNANLQLARLAVDRKQGAPALAYLDRVKQTGPAIRLLRAEALHLAGRAAEAASLLAAVSKEAGNDPRVLFTLGLAAARMGLYDQAESAFSAVAAQSPGDFDVLFNLAAAATRAGHPGRAVRTLEAALQQRPGNVSALLELARAHTALKDHSRAVYLLSQARQQEPANAEVLLFLAHTAQDAGFYGDAVMAFDEYLALRPADERARLDRARVLGLAGSRREEGLREAELYIQKHPSDAAGHFVLAQLIWDSQPDRALEALSTTLRLSPGDAPAHFARAWLLQRRGRVEESLPDLEAASRRAPTNPRALDQLGLAYLSLDRPAEAEKTLRAALAAGPGEREILMHLGQALMALDREPEARQFFERFQKTPASRSRDPRTEAGMIELATLPAAEIARRQIERLARQAGEHPNQPELQLKLAQLLLAEGRSEESQAAFFELQSRNAGAAIWEEAGQTLLRAGRAQLAIPFLERAAAQRPSAWLELAMARYLAGGPEPALRTLDQSPSAGRAGDVLLLRARLLDATGRKQEAERALEAGLRLSASQPQVAQQAALLLLARNRGQEAVALLDQAIRAAPSDPDLLLIRALALALSRRSAEADSALRQIHSRWPEWDRPYLAHGLLLEAAGRNAEARRNLEAARALNPNDAAARCGLARLAGNPDSQPPCSCITELRHILFPWCANP